MGGNPDLQLPLAQACVAHNELPPLNCGPCPFCWPYQWGQYDLYSIGLECTLTKKGLKPGVCMIRHCTIYDFTKYVLERI